MEKFIDSSDYFTIETENIPSHILKKLKKRKLFPSSNIVEIAQNRLKEKEFLNSIKGIKTANYEKVINYDSLKSGLTKFNNNGILKSCEMGYDGKGSLELMKKT